MAIDLQTAQARLHKAKQDVDFYANLIRLLSDPRLAEDKPRQQATESSPAEQPLEAATDRRPAVTPMKRSPHGEVRGKVYEALPQYGVEPLSTAQLFEAITRSGYTFVSKHPIMAINDALSELQQGDKAILVKRNGVTNFWSRPAQGA